jgi:hypothetical protein
MGLFTSKKQQNPPVDSKSKGEQPLDRQSYFRQIRNDFLTKLGLPEGTKPEQVVKIMEIKSALDKIKNKKLH